MITFGVRHSPWIFSVAKLVVTIGILAIFGTVNSAVSEDLVPARFLTG